MLSMPAQVKHNTRSNWDKNVWSDIESKYLNGNLKIILAFLAGILSFWLDETFNRIMDNSIGL